jgi:Ferritin-like domain
MTTRDYQLQRAGARLLRRRAAAGTPQGGAALWPAAHFGLDKLAIYRDADAVTQRRILDDCCHGLLRESWFVERCGMEFCARMVLASSDTAERQLYSLIGADEASHYAWLQPWIDAADPALDAFNSFLADCLARARPQPLAYLLQVVLEGFGIVHYAGLAASCTDPALAATLQRMAEDEALHHAGGLAFFSAQQLDEADREFLREAAGHFLLMLRSGPQAVVAALQRHLPALPDSDVESLFLQLDSAADTTAKLARLRQLMLQPEMDWLVEALTAEDAFTPCPPLDAAALYLQCREIPLG